MSRHVIIERYNQHCFERHVNRLTLSTEGARHQKYFDSFLNDYIEDMRRLANARPQFFADHSYSWCFEATAYDNPVEAMLQRDLLSVMAAISPDNKAYGQLSNIAVRLLGTAELNAHCFESGGFKYIAISTALVRSLSRFSRLMKDLRIYPAKHLLPTEFTNFAELLTALPPGIRQLVEITMVELLNCARYDPAQDVDFNQINIFDLDGFLSAAARESMFHSLWMRRFVITHELAHVLYDDLGTSQRDEREEIKADWIGMTLLSEAYPTESNRFCGPPLFYGVALVYYLIVGTLELGVATANNADLSSIKAGEIRQFLHYRCAMLRRWIDEDLRVGEKALKIYDDAVSIMKAYSNAAVRIICEDLFKMDVSGRPLDN